MRSWTSRSIAQALSFALVAAPAARAEIAGQNVVSGQASFEQNGNATTIHASDGAIIDYGRFSVLANEQLLFVQPSSDARVLNRVFGDATRIDGGLSANGIVYIVNPAGIFFGGTAVVSVGGLYAAAGNLSNEDFLAHSDRFTSLSGPVVNAGSIESPAVALLGASVANHGNIHAPDGTIAMVAGDRVVLTRLGTHLAVSVEGPAGGPETPAIEQTGSVDAGSGSVSFTTGDVYSLAINHTGITRGGEIELRAASGTVQVAGSLDASNHAGGTGGAITVTGERVALVGARLDASGDAGGGSIRVGGDLHGAGALPNAKRTTVDANSALRADALASGDGGRIIVWADESTRFYGSLSARGGPACGDGGFAEISGASLIARGHVDLGATAGSTGTLLYDPKDIVLHMGSADGTDAPDASATALVGSANGQVLFGTPDETTTPFDVYQSELEGTNANIVLQATNSISSPDTFLVVLMGSNSLSAETRNSAGDEAGTALAPGIHLGGVSGGVSFQTSGGSLSFTTGNAGIEVGNLTTMGAAGAVNGNGSNGGAISVIAHDSDRSGTSNVTTGALNSAGGDGTTGTGGNGGAVTVQSIGAVRDVAGTTTDPIEGGGDLSVASVVTTGGAGATRGGNGGSVVLGGTFAPFTGQIIDTPDGTITVGAITTSGGTATGASSVGGNAGSIVALARDADRLGDNDVTLGALTTRGGDGVAAGGNGGEVFVETLESIAITGATTASENQTAAGGGDIQLRGVIDAKEGTPGTAAGDGGPVTFVANGGNLEHDALLSPQIDTSGDVLLNATGNVGASLPWQVKGGGETTDNLTVAAGGSANVSAINAGFLSRLVAAALTTAADIHITQSGGDVIDMSPGSVGQMVVHQANGSGNKVNVELQLSDPDNGKLVFENGSVTGGGVFRAFSNGDIVLGTATSGTAPAITAGANDPALASNVVLRSDLDDDGVGAIVAAPGTASGVIDMKGSATQSGALSLISGAGIGTASDPILTSGVGQLAASNGPGARAANPTATSGIFVRNTGSGDVVIASAAVAGVKVTEGTGSIRIENQVGDIRVAAPISAKPASTAGTGGAVTLAVSSGHRILLNVLPTSSTPSVASGQGQNYDGDVVLRQSAGLFADGGVAVSGRLDLESTAAGTTGLVASLGDGTTFSVQGGIGTQRALGPFTLASRLIGTDEGPLVLDTPAIHASSQSYLSDLTLARTTALSAAGEVEFQGDVAAPAAGVGLTVSTPGRILFDAAGDQSVSTAGGLTLNPAGRASIPTEATIAKTGGNLTLASTGGSLLIGDGEKVSAAGTLSLSGSTVRFTDLSALDISVSSPNALVFARAPGLVTTPFGASFADGGTDLVANTVTFSAPPSVVGAGPAPRIATPSGSASSAGDLVVGRLPAPITSADIASGSRVFDLAIPALEPGHETRELEFDRVAPPFEPRASQDHAGAGQPVSREDASAFFACAPLGEELAPAGCAPPAPPAYGSALDTERASEVARAYRELLGDSPRATEGRAALASAAEDPKAEIGAASGLAGRTYLTEVARVLGQIRLLGLGPRYPEVRSDLLAAVARSIGSPQLDAERLGAAVDARAMGMPI